jgi:hypothetical protein
MAVLFGLHNPNVVEDARWKIKLMFDRTMTLWE